MGYSLKEYTSNVNKEKNNFFNLIWLLSCDHFMNKYEQVKKYKSVRSIKKKDTASN